MAVASRVRERPEGQETRNVARKFWRNLDTEAKILALSADRAREAANQMDLTAAEVVLQARDLAEQDPDGVSQATLAEMSVRAAYMYLSGGDTEAATQIAVEALDEYECPAEVIEELQKLLGKCI